MTRFFLAVRRSSQEFAKVRKSSQEFVLNSQVWRDSIIVKRNIKAQPDGAFPFRLFLCSKWLEVMIVARMTEKQQRFCDEYLIDLNGTQAAIRAGYSKKTAAVIATENLRKPNIQEYIEKRMAEKEESLIAKQNEVMKYLTSVMRRELKESIVVTLQNKTEKWVKDEDTGKLKKQTITEESPAVVEIPAKLSDANKAAELLGKAYAMFTEKIDSEEKVKVTIVDDMDG